MFKRLLIATDGSEIATKAVRAGLELAKSLNAQVAILTVTEPWLGLVNTDMSVINFSMETYEKVTKEEAARLLGKLRDEAVSQGIDCGTLHVNGYPAEAIIQTAESATCDLIVMGSHGRRGIARLLLGSQAAKVVTLSSVPVLICR
jgi:nucleotide-binding universal stress UspA family protein